MQSPIHTPSVVTHTRGNIVARNAFKHDLKRNKKFWKTEEETAVEEERKLKGRAGRRISRGL
jgi:hypothetical protein